MKKLLLLFLLSSAVVRLIAQDLISADELAKQLKNPDVIIVSAELETEYAKVHINGAVNIPYKAFFKPGEIEGLLIPVEQAANILGEKGVSEKKTIVLYDEGSMKYAGRLYFLLKYLGAPNVKILEGGLDAWKAGRKPVTKNPTIVSKTTFTPKVNQALIVNANDVKSLGNNKNAILVDVREVAEFNGTDTKSTGHLPGSINMDHSDLLNEKHMLKDKVVLEKLFTEKGITKDKTIILYCSTGVRAGKTYFVLTSYLNYPNVKVYDGGYNEWKAMGNPIVK